MILDIILSSNGLGSMLSGALEGVGIPWPGAVVLTAAGTKYSGVLGAAVLGTLFSVTYTASSAIQYAIGRYCRQLLERLLSDAMRMKLDRAIEKYGQAAVLWTRPLAVGNYISIPAGMMRMNPVKFLVYTFLGIWPWAFGMALAGGAIGQYMAFATDALPALAAGLVVVTVVAAVRKLWRRSRETEQFGD
ncbi:MAG TPA: VTT domain-containing protein [Symbiobacteriaceae bacterium]|nr:VTT domain-containing protein [Symbiobacteriaceae bacterium]